MCPSCRVPFTGFCCQHLDLLSVYCFACAADTPSSNTSHNVQTTSIRHCLSNDDSKNRGESANNCPRLCQLEQQQHWADENNNDNVAWKTHLLWFGDIADDEHQLGVHSNVFLPKNTTTTCQLLHLFRLPHHCSALAL